MNINYENVNKAYVSINGLHKAVDCIYEVIDGVWVKVYPTFIPIPEDLAIKLIDFYYIENGDGTATLTEWKDTLNGVPSTECVVPDDSRIIL